MRKILIVGLGLSGSVIARKLADRGDFKITIIDKRNHIGGNLFDYKNSKGIRIHKYGPHLFHTNNKKVLDFILNFSEWIEYKHKVKAILSDGTYVTLPVNNETKKIVGKNNIVEIFYRPYSEKMWDMKLEELNPDIINRVPIRNDFNEYYFPNDKYQLLPKNGYTNFIKNMLDHQNINVQTNKFFNKKMETEFDYIFNSMPIDEYYNFKYGKLDYRSMKFHNYDFPSPKLLPVAQVNFTNKGVYTRMTEWKNLPNHGINEEFTTITFEEPCSPEENNNEKYYPVKDLKGFNRSKYMKYKKIKNDKVEFIGRLGLYSYLNMDQCINIALKTSEKYLKKQ
jgi:UDP-galactopyranose mutase